LAIGRKVGVFIMSMGCQSEAKAAIVYTKICGVGTTDKRSRMMICPGIAFFEADQQGLDKKGMYMSSYMRVGLLKVIQEDVCLGPPVDKQDFSGQSEINEVSNYRIVR
jgi:hypothetical protein